MSMRTMKLFANLFMLLVAVVFVGCDKEPAPTPTPPKDDVPLCKVSVEVAAITDASIEFNVTSESADEVRYIFCESSETAPTKETILADGADVEKNATVTLKFEELAPSTKYTLHVAAKNEADMVYAYQEAETEEADLLEPTVSIEVGEVGETSAKFTITTENATNVSYNIYDLASMDPDMPQGELPSADEVLSEGDAIEPNKAVEVEAADLEVGMAYLIVVAAEGEGGTAVKSETFTTTCPAPVLAATLTEDIGYDYAVFNVSAENVEEVKYVCIKAGSRDVTAEQVLKNGTAVESGDVKIEGLDEETAYEVYVAAKGLNEAVVMVDALTFTTEKNIVVYTLAENLSVSSYSYSGTNFFLTFIDEKQGYTLYADFYTTEELGYLPSGEYKLAGMNGGEISSAYTRFLLSLNDTVGSTFSQGSVNVEATPNEETREVYYEISGELYFADGNSVVLSYSGPISGIKLPEVIEGAPEGAYVFEVSPETNMPKRVHGSNLKAGEYYLKFYDSNWNELTLDLFVDPTLCDNGNHPLPTGIYSTGDGSFDTYSSISLYNPYFAGSFTEAELRVDKDGDNYTFTLLGTVVSGSTEKLVYMKYTGEIADMVK